MTINKQEEYCARGLRTYGQLEDTLGSKIWVQDSSSAENQAVWMYTSNPMESFRNPIPHMNKEQVIELIELLQFVVKEMPD